MDTLDNKAMVTIQALETLCFLCWCAPVATGIKQIHFEMGEGITNRSHGLTSLYVWESIGFCRLIQRLTNALITKIR